MTAPMADGPARDAEYVWVHAGRWFDTHRPRPDMERQYRQRGTHNTEAPCRTCGEVVVRRQIDGGESPYPNPDYTPGEWFEKLPYPEHIDGSLGSAGGASPTGSRGTHSDGRITEAPR